MMKDGIAVTFSWKGREVRVAEVPLDPMLASSPDGIVFMAMVCSRLASLLPQEVRRQYQQFAEASQQQPMQGAANGAVERVPEPR